MPGPTLVLPSIEFLGPEVAVVFRELLDQRHRQQRHVARRGELAGIGQAAGVAELGGVHADARRGLGHAHARRPPPIPRSARRSAAATSLAERATSACRPCSTVMPWPGPRPSLEGGLARATSRQGHGRGQREPAGLQLLEDEVDRHHLGERGGIPEGPGIAVQQRLAGGGVDHHVGAGLDGAGRRGYRGDLGMRGGSRGRSGRGCKAVSEISLPPTQEDSPASIRPSARPREALDGCDAQSHDRPRHPVPAELLHRLVRRDHGRHRRRPGRRLRHAEGGDRPAGHQGHQGAADPRPCRPRLGRRHHGRALRREDRGAAPGRPVPDRGPARTRAASTTSRPTSRSCPTAG